MEDKKVYEKLEKSFFSFINASVELGKHSRNELNHSDFDPTEKDSVTDAVQFFGELVETVNRQFDNFKNNIK